MRIGNEICDISLQILSSFSKEPRKELKSQFKSIVLTMDTLPRTLDLLVLPVGFGKPHSTYTLLPLYLWLEKFIRRKSVIHLLQMFWLLMSALHDLCKCSVISPLVKITKYSPHLCSHSQAKAGRLTFVCFALI